MRTMGLLGSETPTLTWHNRGFVMPSPRTTDQAGHYPICQQCHEDARDVGEPGNVNKAQNAYSLVETHDNLCLNCHAVTSLP